MNFFKKLHLSLLFLFITNLSHAQGWSELGGFNSFNDQGNINDIEFDNNGNLYVSGWLRDPQYRSYIKKWDGHTWTQIGGIDVLGVYGTMESMCIDNFGNVYVGGFLT